MLELTIEIAQEVFDFIYDVALASDPSNPVYSLTASLSSIGPGPGATANLVWAMSIKNQNWFCAPVPTQANYEYPVGFGVVDSQGVWYVNPSTVNTAASPVFYGRGTICYPLTSGYIVEDFGSEVYFILQYNPSTAFTVSMQGYGPGGLGAYMVDLPSSTCPG